MYNYKLSIDIGVNMNIETENILGTLKIITEPPLEFHLPNNETTYLLPFVWDVSQKGEFSLLNLGINEGWITTTDIEVAVENWLAIEKRGYLNLDDDPDYYEDIITPEFAEERAKIYQMLAKVIHENLHDIEVLKFDQSFDYSFFVVLGRTQDNTWFCFSETVPRETKLSEEIKVSKLNDYTNQNNVNSKTSYIREKFQEILSQLRSVSIYGYYGGGYDYRYHHYLVQGIAPSKSEALLITLNQAGMLNIANFHEFNPEALAWRLDEYELVEILPRYKKLNQFLNSKLLNIKMIRCSFWNRDYIYVVGQTKSGDLAGIYIKSDFDYNP